MLEIDLVLRNPLNYFFLSKFFVSRKVENIFFLMFKIE